MLCVCAFVGTNNSPYGVTTYGPGVESNSNKNEYQEYFLKVKAAGE